MPAAEQRARMPGWLGEATVPAYASLGRASLCSWAGGRWLGGRLPMHACGRCGGYQLAASSSALASSSWAAPAPEREAAQAGSPAAARQRRRRRECR